MAFQVVREIGYPDDHLNPFDDVDLVVKFPQVVASDVLL